MIGKNENQLSEHIKEVLLQHEEAYVLGSWERFQRNKKKNKRIRQQKLFLAIAASILLILTSAIAFINLEFIQDNRMADNPQTEQPGSHKFEPALPSSKPEQAPSLEVEPNKEPAYKYIAEGNSYDETKLPNQTVDRSAETSFDAAIRRKSVPQPSLFDGNDVPSSQFSEMTAKFSGQSLLNHQPREPNTLASDEIVAKEDLRYSINSTRQKDLVFSVAYASVMNIHNSETDLGAGGGFYADWNFTRNLSVSSGIFIAQNRLEYSGESGVQLMEHFSDGTPTTLSGNDLDSVQLDFLNLEIPLNISYFLSNGLSFSAGISSLALIKEEYNYNFEYEQEVQVFEENETTGLQPTTKIVTMRTTQTQSKPSLEKMNWAAFYTFSVGYQKEIFQRHTASIEPFIKIPAGGVTSQHLTYTTSGIQLKISF